MSGKITWAFMLASTSTLAACGGGGGGDTPPPPVPATTYTVSVTPTGVEGAGLVLQLNGAGNLSVTPGGGGTQTFTNRVVAGAAYAVTILSSPGTPTQQCTVTNGSGPSINANVANVTVDCKTFISGVAAVGSPLAGTVSVKDANGVVRSTPLGGNGTYAADVTGMTAPFVFRAEGSANGHTYTVYSAAVAADAGGTINITQLTDLVVDNIAGQVASAYYNNGNFSSLTPVALAAELAILKTRLLPVLTALGVDASIDLLRSRFTPLASALDSALDILRVSVNPATNIATITNIVTQQQIQDAINVPAAAEPTPPILDNTGNIDVFATDSAAIRAALTGFIAKFATGLPSVQNIEASLTTTFLTDDEDRATFAADLATESELIGSRLTDINIINIDYGSPPYVTATVEFTVANSNGIEDSRVSDWRVRKDTDGVWRLHGDQHVLDTDAGVFEHRLLPSGCVSTRFSFSIEDNNSVNNGGLINHIMVYGPGLPAGGLRYVPPATGGGDWGNTVQGSSHYILATNCVTGPPALTDVAIAAISDNARYLFVAYTSADNSAQLNFPSGAITSGPDAGKYELFIEKRPLTLAETIASTAFPTIVSPNAAQLAAYISGPLTITVTGLNPNLFAYLSLSQSTASGNYRDASAWLPSPANGVLSTILSLTPSAPGDAITFRNVKAETQDAYRRTFETGYY